ncbi:uncharacterized protein L201_002454 [Kwoniella dendrophila CBS 6074]|uniref:Malate dehydrogenase n=1 Tax=Kwoniella dendrophila CBS 6074 TaxID=1295534 RepID=A0AAX4JS30_9TREE
MFLCTFVLAFMLCPSRISSIPIEATSSAKTKDPKSDIQNLVSRLSNYQNCQIINYSVPFNGISGLTVPNNERVSRISVGRGIQNYTCTQGNYVSAGALANLFDVSCVYTMSANIIDSKTVDKLLPQVAYSALSYPYSGQLPIAIHHEFVDTPGSSTAGSISPKFYTSIGTENVIVKKINGVNDPINPSINVPWLQLGALENQGTLSKSVFRLNTYKGQPPSSCTKEGEQLSVEYAAMYWFTK